MPRLLFKPLARIGSQSIIADLARDIFNQRAPRSVVDNKLKVIMNWTVFRIRRRGDLMKAAELKAGLINKQKYMVAQLDQGTTKGCTLPPTITTHTRGIRSGPRLL